MPARRGHLDAPVSGGPYGAEAGTRPIMVGGSDPDFARPIFESLGKATLVGPDGAGQLAKLGSQIILAGAMGTISDALLLAVAGGADAEKVREAWSGGFADSKVLQIHGARMVQRDFVSGGHIRTHLKDLDAARASADEHELNLPLMDLMRDTLKTLSNQDMGDQVP